MLFKYLCLQVVEDWKYGDPYRDYRHEKVKYSYIVICNIDWPQQIVSLTIKVRIFIHVEDEKVTALNRTNFFLAIFCQITMMSHYLWQTSRHRMICDVTSPSPGLTTQTIFIYCDRGEICTGYFVAWNHPSALWARQKLKSKLRSFLAGIWPQWLRLWNPTYLPFT